MDFLTAWRTHAEWRDHFVDSATRELSKHGDLGSYAHVYRALAVGLTPAEAVSLYQQLRQSQRAEFEWRNQFLALFPQVGPADLPPPLENEAEERRRAALAHEESLRVYGARRRCVADEDIPF